MEQKQILYNDAFQFSVANGTMMGKQLPLSITPSKVKSKTETEILLGGLYRETVAFTSCSDLPLCHKKKSSVPFCKHF